MIDTKFRLSHSKPVVPQVPVGIIGVGSYLPPTIVKNEDFKHLQLSEEEQSFMDNQSGIKERRWARDETFTDMAVKAGQAATDNAGIDVSEIDMIVVTHITRDLSQLTPPNSVTIQTKLGAKNATAINIDQGFTGWMYALITGAGFVASGFYKTVLVVSGESILSHTDSTIMKTMLVGDGGGAFVLRQTEPGYGLQAFHLMSEQYPEIAAEVKVDTKKAGPWDTDPSLKAYFTISPNSFARDLPYVENFLPYSMHQSLGVLRLQPDEVDHYIFAQKFEWLNRRWATNTGVDYAKVHETIAEHTCVETSSIPIITADAVQKGKLKKGDLVAFADLGSNWSVASAVFRWCI